MVVVEPAVGGWCAHSVCRYLCVLIVFVTDTQVAISFSVLQYNLLVGNKFVRLDFGVKLLAAQHISGAFDSRHAAKLCGNVMNASSTV